MTNSSAPRNAEIVICGAGIAGISAAYFLSVRHGLRDVLLVDPLPPLSLTSDKSSECYRNWWPNSSMVALMNRSIDLLEELSDKSGDIFHLTRRGYLYATADQAKIPVWQRTAQAISALGAGTLRLHTGSPDDPPYQPHTASAYTSQPDGADLILDPVLLRRHFPYLAQQTAAALHVRRAGWFSGQQLGSYLLDQARQHGTRLLRAEVTEVELKDGQVQAVRLGDGQRVSTPCFVNAAGPLVNRVASLVNIELPVFNELHLKVSLRDRLVVAPRQAPLLIWDDPQRLPWSTDERQLLAEDSHGQTLLGQLPSGAHTRPEGGPQADILLMLWAYHTAPLEPVWPIPLDPFFADVALRGLSTMLPGLRAYIDNPGRPYIDGGYYTRTPENLPLVGPLPGSGAYMIGALSGFGLMAACAAGELLAQHICGGSLPPYASAFLPERYQDPAYMESISQVEDSGQL